MILFRHCFHPPLHKALCDTEPTLALANAFRYVFKIPVCIGQLISMHTSFTFSKNKKSFASPETRGLICRTS